MKQILQITPLFIDLERKPTKTSERSEMIGKFADQINLQRKGKYRPLGYAYIGMRLSHLSLRDLHYLWSVCSDADRRGDSFSKVFFGSLKA